MDYRAALNRVMPPAVRPSAAKGTPGTPEARADACENAGNSPRQPVAPPEHGKTVRVERAVFTSIRTPMGEGYRIVAAGAGITPTEKAEITSRSPSHGALLDKGAAALGLLTYPLSGGRYCVSASRYGGTEHTGRGGERVWTDVVVLDEAAFRALGCNPIRIHGALVAAVPGPQAKLPTVLEPMELRAWDGLDASGRSVRAGEMDPFARVVFALLTGDSWVVAGAVPALGVLENAFDMVPVSQRGALSVSAGLGFCLGRRSSLAFVGSERQAAQRVMAGQNLRWCDLDAAATPEATPFDDWLTLVQVRAAEGRLSSMFRLTARMTEAIEAAGLRRLAGLVSDYETACRADDEERAALRELYASFKPQGALEEERHQKLSAALAPVAEAEDVEESMDADKSGVRTSVEDCQLRLGQ